MLADAIHAGASLIVTENTSGKVDAARTARQRSMPVRCRFWIKKVLSCEQEDRSELPVRSVHDQDQFLTIDKTQDELGDQFLGELVLKNRLARLALLAG